MKRLFLAVLLVLSFIGFLCHAAFVSPAAAAEKPPTTIKFKGGSCEISAIMESPPFAPADMKEGEKSFMLRFRYTLDKGTTADAVGALYEKGRLKAPDGKTYKAGVSAIMEDDSIYSLLFAVPADIDVWTLKFTFDKSTTESMKVEGDRMLEKLRN
jgi:hypothetical protein